MKKADILVTFTLTLILAGLLSCASGRLNLAESGAIHIEEVPSTDKYVIGVTAYEDGDGLIIKGKVRGLGSSIGSRGHIDIVVVSPDGKILTQSSAPILPRTTLRKRTRNALRSHFETRLGNIPPAGSAVRIAYHRSDPPIREVCCNENEALYYSK